jgi:histidyl-tRNA synthetase
LYEGPAVIFINFGPKEAMHSLKVVSQLRKEGIAAEVYATDAKMKKQMKYANDRNIPFVALIGTEEMESGKITLRDMKAGSQEVLDQSGLLLKLKAD